MPAFGYQYNRPHTTYTIDLFIACQSSTEISYNNLSFVDKVEYPYMNEVIHYPTYNILSDYIEEIRENYCVNVSLSDEDMYRYMYRPKLLCHYIYGNGELAFIILIINDMYSVKQFNRKDILMPTKNNMNELCKYLYNSNYRDIAKYNSKSNI